MNLRDHFKNMMSTFLSYISKPKHIFLIIFLFVLAFMGVQILSVYPILSNFFSLPSVSFTRKLSVFYEYVFQTYWDKSLSSKIITAVFSLLISLDIFFFLIYAKRQKDFLALEHKSFLASVWGIILGFFGVGCLSCGAFILAPVLTFFGLRAYVTTIQEHAIFISIVGIIIIFLSILYLLYQISKPIVCKTTF